jgi:cell division septation protein DedD
MDVFDQVTKFANTASTNVNDSIRENLTSTSDQVLDVVLDTNRRIVDLAVSTADRISAQIDLEVPFADRLPTPTAAGERYLEFVEQAVSLNREMTERVVEMLQADDGNGVAATAEKATARKAAAKKPTARKAAARKPAAKKSTAKKAPARKAATKSAASATTSV